MVINEVAYDFFDTRFRNNRMLICINRSIFDILDFQLSLHAMCS